MYELNCVVDICINSLNEEPGSALYLVISVYFHIPCHLFSVLKYF